MVSPDCHCGNNETVTDGSSTLLEVKMKRILIADDDDILRMLITDTLEDTGCAIDTAEDGEEAFQLLQKKKYELLIVDYMMPQLSGMELIQKLDPAIKEETYILMLTAKAQETDKEAALQNGADFFIAKPFSPAELLVTVEGLLG
jgi:DNA-binding response OmpR family regulator